MAWLPLSCDPACSGHARWIQQFGMWDRPNGHLRRYKVLRTHPHIGSAGGDNPAYSTPTSARYQERPISAPDRRPELCTIVENFQILELLVPMWYAVDTSQLTATPATPCCTGYHAANTPNRCLSDAKGIESKHCSL